MAVFTITVFFPGKQNLCHNPITFPVERALLQPPKFLEVAMAHDKPVSKLVSTRQFICSLTDRQVIICTITAQSHAVC